MKKMQYGLLSIAVGLASCALLLAQPPAGGPGGGKGPGGPGGGKGGGKGGGGPVFSVSTSAWEDGAVIPLKHTFYGGPAQGTSGPSPAFDFHWTQGGNPAAAPAALQSYAVVFHDAENSTAKTTVDTLHWSAFNIPGTAKGIPEGIPAGESPDGTRNGPGIRGGLMGAYFGPGAGAGPYHHYIFEFYALDAKLDITGAATRDELMKAMDGHVIGKAVYYARFANNPGAK
ncbi:MAG: YbhB/YbcL family Raf kinase inhibitor-like protein [Acidobacteriota bacterium]